MLQVYIRQIRISWKNDLSSGLQNSNPQKNGFSILKLRCWWLFFSHVYRSEFWNPDERWFFQLILICFIHTCNIKVTIPWTFWFGLEKPGAHCDYKMWPKSRVWDHKKFNSADFSTVSKYLTSKIDSESWKFPIFIGSLAKFWWEFGKNRYVGLISDQNWSFRSMLKILKQS